MFLIKSWRTVRTTFCVVPGLLFLNSFASSAVAQNKPDTKPAANAKAAPDTKTVPKTEPVRRLALTTNDLVYNARTKCLIVSVPSKAGAKGNSIVSIDPQTLVVSDALFVGSEPNKLALSDNGVDLYVGLDGSASVRRVNLKTNKVGPPFTLGEWFGPLYVEDMAVMPGDPNVVAIARLSRSVSPRHAGVAVYDNGVPRPKTTPEHTGSNAIEWGNGGRIYGFDNESSEYGFRRMEVTASGITVVDTTRQLIAYSNANITYSDGRIYATTGAILNAEAKTLAGTLNTPGLVCPDAALKRVWVLSNLDDRNHTLKAFDTDTFLEVGSQPLNDVEGAPAQLVRWGKTGLAFRTNGGQIVVISNAPGL